MCRFAPAKRTSRIGFQTRPIAISSDPACTQVHGYGREMEFERTLAHHGLVDQTVCHPAIKSRAENFPWAKKKRFWLLTARSIYDYNCTLFWIEEMTNCQLGTTALRSSTTADTGSLPSKATAQQELHE